MNQKNLESVNIFEQISQICRDFRKQIAEGRSPRLEKYLSAIPEDGRENLFSNLLEIEINFRQRKSQEPSTDEYLKRFPQFATQVRRAFFEPTMASMDSGGSGDEATRSLKNALGGSEHTLTFQIPDANRLGDYELMRELGRGGMGVVYEARHTKTNNRVALKTLPTGGRNQEVNADKLYRFRREFRRLSEINHPNLVGMQTLEVDGSQWFFTMDLIDGDDFLNYVRPEDKVDEKRLRSCIAQLARGVTALHRERIVHRDLKPSNVLVSPDGRVSILDFGLAAEMQKTADMTQTKSGMFAGTPRYAAPEQMFGDRTEASDWYAFGTMLYEALAGEPPFSGKDQVQLLRDKQNLEAPSLNERLDVPDDLAQIADGLIRREPVDRMSAESVSDLLELNLDTRSAGSTPGSHGSSAGSVSGEELDLENLEEKDTVLIGRDEQLAELESIKSEFLKSRKPQVVWVTGLSGEGKSSLVQKFLRPIHMGEEMLVLSGRCYDRESVPFKVIDSYIDSLVRFLRSRSDGELQQFLPVDIVALAKLFPVLRRIGAISNQDTRKIAVLDDNQIHNLAFSALKELLFNIGQQFPIAIFVDDLQWGDADSAEAIFKQLAFDSPPRILMLGSYRSDEIDESPFWKVWKKQSENHVGSVPHRRIEVEPLSPQQAAQLLAMRTGLSPEVITEQAGELISDAHGNPYFLEQLIEGLDAATGTFSAVPLKDIISEKLRRLPTEATDLLDVISVAGKGIPLDEVSQVAGLKGNAFGTITHMRSERLVRMIGAGEQQSVDTYHDKIRETILVELSDQKRKELHRKFAETIERIEESAKDGPGGGTENHSSTRCFDIAHHYFEAEDTRAFRYQLLAGRISLEAGAMEATLEHIEKAKKWQPSNVDSEYQYQIHFASGMAHAATKSLNEAIKELSAALQYASTRSQKALCYHQLSESHWKRNEYDEALKCTRQGFSEFGLRLPRTTLGKGMAILFSAMSFHFLPTRFNRKLRKFSEDEIELLSRMYADTNGTIGQLDVLFILFPVIQGCVLAKSSDNVELKCVRYTQYAWTLRLAGLPWVGRQLVNRAKSLVENEDDIPARYVYQLGTFYYGEGELDIAEQHFLKAESGLIRTGDYQLWNNFHFLWHLWSIRGNASKIVYYANGEAEFARESRDQIILAYSNYGKAEGLAKQGKTNEALECAESALESLASLRATFTCMAHVQLARVLLQIGDYKRAQTELVKSIRLLPALKFFEITFPALPLYVDASVSLDWWKRSQQSSKSRLTFKTNLCGIAARWLCTLFPNQQPPTFRSLGRFAFARGKKRKAIKYFDKAIAVGEKIGAEYELARSRIDKSLLDYPDSQADREKGLELLESLGCVLPDSELEYLNLNRAEHHARAATARKHFRFNHFRN